MSVTGSDDWWRKITGPQIVVDKGVAQVTLWWRDPDGSEATSATRRVWVYITGITDHHCRSLPQSMTRVPGTDAWCWQTVLSATWRGSYCFIPSCREDDFAAALFTTATPDLRLLREGWRKLLPQAIADPLNQHSWQGGRGHAVSALEMPQAPVQVGWSGPDVPYSSPVCITWHSTRLANQRRVWIYTTGDSEAAQRPLAVLLDGQFWADSMPVWPALARLTAAGKLPPAVYLLIDVIDNRQRSVELPCNGDFWQAIQDELLPQVQQLAPFRDQAESTVVAGQSFGGLAAMFAALYWPQRFGCVLSQSGSYWWPHQDSNQDGVLIERLRQGELHPQGLRIWLAAGKCEPLILQANQALREQLQQAGQTVFWHQVDGGHDAFCWRGGLMAGLMQLWQPLCDKNDE